jgi:hypothetical protein
VSQRNGPQQLPPEIYRRRRIAAVVVLVVVVALLWWIVSSLMDGGDDSTEQTAQTSSAPVATETSAEASEESTDASESAAPSESESADPSESEQASESEKTGEPDAPDEVANKTTCDVEDLQLSVRPGSPTFPEGEQPNFFLEVTNPTSGDCDIDLSENELSFEVFTLGSSYDRVWSDTDCNRPTSSGSLELDAKQSRTYEMTGWSRTSSSPDSCDNREPVGPGAYMVYGHVGDNTSEQQTFNLG